MTPLSSPAGTTLNYEDKSSYSVIINVDDNIVGTAPDATIAYTLTLTDVNEAPVITTPNVFSIQENTANSTAVGIVTGSDVEGNSLSNWTITDGNADVNGNNQSAFAIDPTTGQITVNDSGDLDYETKSQFTLQVTVSDGTLTSNAGNVTINLTNVTEFTPGIDTARGTSGNDIMDALDGNDLIYGFDGNDTIFSGAGADIAYGGNENDTIYGGTGDDRLYGDAANDILYGDAGNDILYGGDSNDFLYGGDSNDRLYGDAGNDFLYGGDGNDFLYGGDGNDYLNGGLGSDRYYGEAGRDTFVIGLGQGSDSIYGYETGGVDRIFVLGSIPTFEQKSGNNVLIKSGTETLATLFNVAPRQIFYQGNA